MSCCEKKQSVREFVIQKAKNMRAMLDPFIKTEEHKKLLSQYNENDVETLIHTHLAPLYATGTLSVATETLCTELAITDPIIKDKISRYLMCFCESMLVK
jgi:hypothetical protein